MNKYENDALNELANLDSGWLNGEGEVISESCLRDCQRFLDRIDQNDIVYDIAPTPDGGILVEFKVDGWDYSVDFEDDGQFWFYGVEIGGCDDVEKAFSSCQFDNLVKFVIGLFNDAEVINVTETSEFIHGVLE